MSSYNHSVGVRKVFPDVNGTRLVFIDDKNSGFLLSPANVSTHLFHTSGQPKLFVILKNLSKKNVKLNFMIRNSYLIKLIIVIIVCSSNKQVEDPQLKKQQNTGRIFASVHVTVDFKSSNQYVIKLKIKILH